MRIAINNEWTWMAVVSLGVALLSAGTTQPSMAADSPQVKEGAVKRFPIGFWNYVDVKDQDASAVKDWAEAGMTLAMSPEFGPAAADIERMRQILDAAQAADIKVILCDSRAHWRYRTSKGAETYRRDFQKAVADLGGHPAVMGFHIGDEPGEAEFDDTCRALRTHQELAPGLTPFVNLLPMYPDGPSPVSRFTWDRYLDEFIAQGSAPFLCYDCYTQMQPEAEEDEWQGHEMYFGNLLLYWQAATRHDLDYWTTLSSVGHANYRCPSENSLRWQLNTAVASGAKGILWFFFYMRQPHDNYRLSPIDEHGERTETYHWLSRVCRTFLKWHAPVLMECRLVRAWHVGRQWGGWPAFDGSGLVTKAKSSVFVNGVWVPSTPLILSEFKHSGGATYLAVVNNSQTDNTHAELTLADSVTNLYRVDWLGKEEAVVVAAGQDAARRKAPIEVRRWLAPGQMELFRVEDERPGGRAPQE